MVTTAAREERDQQLAVLGPTGHTSIATGMSHATPSADVRVPGHGENDEVVQPHDGRERQADGDTEHQRRAVVIASSCNETTEGCSTTEKERKCVGASRPAPW
jgi:hypothetical protein